MENRRQKPATTRSPRRGLRSRWARQQIDDSDVHQEDQLDNGRTTPQVSTYTGIFPTVLYNTVPVPPKKRLPKKHRFLQHCFSVFHKNFSTNFGIKSRIFFTKFVFQMRKSDFFVKLVHAYLLEHRLKI
jgi:hypothetical protein